MVRARKQPVGRWSLSPTDKLVFTSGAVVLAVLAALIVDNTLRMIRRREAALHPPGAPHGISALPRPRDIGRMTRSAPPLDSAFRIDMPWPHLETTGDLAPLPEGCLASARLRLEGEWFQRVAEIARILNRNWDETAVRRAVVAGFGRPPVEGVDFGAPVHSFLLEPSPHRAPWCSSFKVADRSAFLRELGISEPPASAAALPVRRNRGETALTLDGTDGRLSGDRAAHEMMLRWSRETPERRVFSLAAENVARVGGAAMARALAPERERLRRDIESALGRGEKAREAAAAVSRLLGCLDQARDVEFGWRFATPRLEIMVCIRPETGSALADLLRRHPGRIETEARRLVLLGLDALAQAAPDAARLRLALEQVPDGLDLHVDTPDDRVILVRLAVRLLDLRDRLHRDAGLPPPPSSTAPSIAAEGEGGVGT